MGHELWTSPITGYRRKGTRLAELHALLGGGITAHAVVEPLKSCPADAGAAEMAHVLREKDFDVAGVQSRPHGPVIGFVATDELQEGLVRDHVQPLTVERLASDATPLRSLLSILKGKEHVFVLVGSNVRGIVTRADLNKPPVRVYLFGLISLLEMHLGFWARDAYPNEGWRKKLAPGRLKKAEKLQRDRTSRKQDTTLFECLQFCDKRDLVLARNQLRERLRLGSVEEARTMLGRAENLRNLLAHSQRDLTHGSSWEETIDLVEWVEATVQRSDSIVEKKARRSARGAPDPLWGSA